MSMYCRYETSTVFRHIVSGNDDGLQLFELVLSSSSPRSNPCLVVDSSFLLSNSLGMTFTTSSTWSRVQGRELRRFAQRTRSDIRSCIIAGSSQGDSPSFGISFVTSPIVSESAELARQHSAQQFVQNPIRARDTDLVTSDPKSFWWYLRVVK